MVVSCSECGLEGHGFDSHHSPVAFVSPDRLLPGVGSAQYGHDGAHNSGHNVEAGTTDPNFIHFTDESLRLLVFT